MTSGVVQIPKLTVRIRFPSPAAIDCPSGCRGCNDRAVPDEQGAVPVRVVEAYDQMMRQVIGPALRQLGFRRTVREFKYGDRSQFGAVRWQKDGRAARAQLLAFTANVDYWCGEDRIGSLMPVPAYDTWWDIRGGQSYDSVAESVISAVLRYALPAIQAGLEDRQQPRVGWQSGYLGDTDDGGASTSSFSCGRPALTMKTSLRSPAACPTSASRRRSS